MKAMINNTSAVKLEASKGMEFKELCRKRGVTQSETFLKTVMKAVNRAYDGPQGILKCRFKQKYGGKIDRLQEKTKPIIIGARISPELKIKVLRICDINKISESVFYRWAINDELNEAKKTRKHKLLITPLYGNYRLTETSNLSPMAIVIKKMQENYLKTQWESEQRGSVAGLLMAFGIPFISRFCKIIAESYLFPVS